MRLTRQTSRGSACRQARPERSFSMRPCPASVCVCASAASGPGSRSTGSAQSNVGSRLARPTPWMLTRRDDAQSLSWRSCAPWRMIRRPRKAEARARALDTWDGGRELPRARRGSTAEAQNLGRTPAVILPPAGSHSMGSGSSRSTAELWLLGCPKSLSENGPIAANRARAALSAFFNWAMREGLSNGNPVVGTNRAADERSRDRVLSDEELSRSGSACREDDYGRIVRLLILTGQRRDEVGGISSSELDFARAVWSIPRRPHQERPPT